MRKHLFIILMVCLAIVGLVSCKNEIEPAQEELIYVSFENGTSRALTATLESFDVDGYYWSYEAQKNDGSGLKSGTTVWNETGADSVPVQSGKGLDDTNNDPVKVPGFSKGYWNFRLFAYADAERTELAYWGEADAVLIDSGHHLASVTVSPVAGGNGYLKVGTITFNPASSISAPTDLVVYTDEIFKLENNVWVLVNVEPVNNIYTLPAKQYKFTRTYSYEGIPVANGSVIVTIYSNLTTTVSGSLSELTTYAEFEGKQNPDAVNVVASASNLEYDTESTASHTLVVESSTKVQATVTQGSVNEIIASTASALNIGLDEDTSTDMTLSLGVDTVASTATSVVYEISMTAEINYKKTVGETVVLDETTTADVKSVEEYVTATIQMQTGLLDVKVFHDGNLMVESTDTADDQGHGIYSYDSSTGVLTIVTKTFSPFSVNYSFPKDVAVARIGTVYYDTLGEAVAAVPDTGVQTVIFMLRDTSLANGITVSAEKNIVLELNGHIISGNTDSSSTYALITNRGILTIQDSTDTEKNGTGSGLLTTYISNPDQQDVPGYASNTITNNGTLIVESGKIVNNGTGYACYAIDNQTNGNSYSPVLIINGGRFEQMNAYTYAIRMFCNSTTKTNSVTVNGGVITGGYGLWLQTPNDKANKAELVINGGTLEANDGAALYVGGTKADNSQISIDITGGVVNGTGVIIQGPHTGRYGHLLITGGEFKNVQCGANVDNFITGGTFSANPTDYVKKGYKAENIGDVWVVSKLTSGVACIEDGEDTLYFETIQDAIAAVGPEDTVTLLEDLEITQVIEVNKSLTIDGDGHSMVIPDNAPSSVSRIFNFDSNTDDIVFTLNNITVNARTADRERAISFYANTGKIVVNINHSTISSAMYAINVASANSNITINIDDSTCSTGWCAIQTWSANSVFNIRNSTLSGVNDKTYNADGWNNFSTIVFNESATGAQAFFENCDIKAKQTTGNKQTLVSFRAENLVNEYVDCRFFVDDVDISDDIQNVADNWNFKSWDAINTATLVINGETVLTPIND